MQMIFGCLGKFKKYMMDFFQGKYRILIKNCGWLYIIQLLNYIVPLVIIPFLLRVLGAEKYGMFAMTQAFMMYLFVVVEYGFNLTASRKIAMTENIKDQEKIFNHTIFFQLAILFLCVSLAMITLLFFSCDFVIIQLFLCSILYVSGSIFFPVWFFQGIENMKFITLINFFSKIIYLTSVIFCVRSSDDLVFLVFLYSLSTAMSGIVAMIVLQSVFDIRLHCLPSKGDLKEMLKESKPVFIANACGNIYLQGATLITGFLVGHSAAGYFSLGQKVSGTIVSLAQPFAQAVYPHVCKIYSKKEEFDKFFYKTLRISVLLNFFIVLITIFSSEYISIFLKGELDHMLSTIVCMFAIVTFAMALNVIIHPFVLASGKYALVENVYFSVSIIFLIISLPLAYVFQVYGMVAAMIVVAFYIVFRYLKILYKESDKVDV